jgi:hypothetical protein
MAGVAADGQVGADLVIAVPVSAVEHVNASFVPRHL